MKKWKRAVLVALVFAVGLVGCTQERGDNPVETAVTTAKDPIKVRQSLSTWEPLPDGAVQKYHAFSAKTAAAFFQQPGNVLYSPISMYYALSIATAGAKGETLDQLLGALEVDSLDELTEMMYRHALNVRRNDEGALLDIRNSIWINDDGIELKPEYLGAMMEKLFSSVYRGSFDSESMKNHLKKEIYEGTGGKIDNPAFTLKDTMSTVILNTVNYKANWKDAFYDETIDKDFVRSDGTKFETTYLQQNEEMSFARTDQYTIVDKPSFLGAVRFVQPAEGVAIEDLAKDPEAIQRMLDAALDRTAIVDMLVPKLSEKGQLEDIVKTLQKLGVKDAFESSIADFTNMSETRQYISDIVQEATVDFTVEGVQATAYTAISMDATSARPQEDPEKITFHLDRPFLYFIVDQEGFPAFMGLYRGL